MVVFPGLMARNLPPPREEIMVLSWTSHSMTLVASLGETCAVRLNSLLSCCVNVAGNSMRATLGASTVTTHCAVTPPASCTRAVMVVFPGLMARNLPSASMATMFLSWTSHSMTLVASLGKTCAVRLNSLLSCCVNVAGNSMRCTLGAGTRTTHWAVTPPASCARAVMVVSPTLSARNLPPPREEMMVLSATSHTIVLVASLGEICACSVNSLLSC